MSASSGGRDQAEGDLETRNGLDSPKLDNPANNSRSPAASRTDLDDGSTSVSSASSRILATHSDVDKDFYPDLTKVFPSPVKVTPEKDVVIDKIKN